MIPKIIHYCWFGGNPLPNDVKKCIESWKKNCPDYEIKEWNDSNFDLECHPFVVDAYNNKAWAFVSDYARLKVVYDNGGIYFDTDVELLRSPDFLLEHDCYIGVQQDKLLCTTGLGYGAVKGSPVVKRMMEQYDAVTYVPENKETFACPFLNAKVFAEMGYHYSDDVVKLAEATVYPTRFFDPIAPGDSKNLLCEDTVSIHHYAASWTSRNNRMKRKLFRMIGEEKIHKIKTIVKRRG